MSAISFLCPYCSAQLRIQDRSFIGKRVGCPDCKLPLQIVEDDGQVVATPVDTPRTPDPDVFSLDDLDIAPEEVPEETPAGRSPHARTAAPAVQTRQPAKTAPAPKTSPAPAPRSVPVPRPIPVTASPTAPATVPAPAADSFQPPQSPGLFSTLPQQIAWGLAIVLFGSLIGFIFSQPSSSQKPIAQTVPKEEAEAPIAPVAEEKDEDATVPVEEEPRVATFETRLRALEARLAEYLVSKGRFPGGGWGSEELPVADRLSWLAELEEMKNPAASPPLLDRSWRDPLNDRFVRRRIIEFQNPDVAELVGVDGYPASHFVGISGVGRDAARLAKTHARAGIFGDDRKTTVADVRDGLSQTMMIAGVSKELGNWAAAGQPTLRSFTREPYVNGPDGFGSGQPDSMLVLMADGSVRTISTETDLRIVRRMAAMADGLPLDESVPGEPGETFPSPPTPAPEPVARTTPMPNPTTPSPAPPAPEPPPPPEPEPIDIAGLLTLKIVRFEQPKPVPLFQLLLQVEELLGASIRADREELGPIAAKLDAEIRVDRTDVTLQDLLAGMLEGTGLQYRIERAHIQIIAASEDRRDESEPDQPAESSPNESNETDSAGETP